MPKKFFFINCLPIMAALMYSAPSALAQSASLPLTTTSSGSSNGLLTGVSADCLSKGVCQLCDFYQVFINAGNLILAVFGGVALVFILWNLFGMIQSRGAEEKINEAKKGIWTTLAGVVITLIVWQIIGLIVKIYTGKDIMSNLCTGGANVGNAGTTLTNPMTGGADTFSKVVNLTAAAFPPVIGAVFFFAFVVNGFKWLTAAGNEEKIKEGVKGMLYAAIGLLLFFGSYVMLRFIIESFTQNPDRLRSLLIIPAVFAQSASKTLDNPLTGSPTLLGPEAGLIWGRLTFMFLRYAGVVAFISLTYAGFLYLTAQGKEEQITKSRSILIWSSLALVAILSAYAISAFVLKAFNPGNMLITPQNIP